MQYKQSIFEKKYRYKNETLDGFYKRVSGGDSVLEELMRKDMFVFGGRILNSRGTAKDGIKSTYSNCYVPKAPRDTIEDIFDTAKYIARIYSYGGGCGLNLSYLRPKDSRVNNAAKASSGASSFAPLYDVTTKVIGQEGRRGALMLSLMCTHPDIIDFINMKSNVEVITSANISVMFTDAFLIASKQKKMFDLTFTVEATGQVLTKTVCANSVMMDFAFNNHDNAEPKLGVSVVIH